MISCLQKIQGFLIRHFTSDAIFINKLLKASNGLIAYRQGRQKPAAPIEGFIVDRCTSVSTHRDNASIMDPKDNMVNRKRRGRFRFLRHIERKNALFVAKSYVGQRNVHDLNVWSPLGETSGSRRC